MGAAALEGLVDDPEAAKPLFAAGSGVSLAPCHSRGAVGPMAGVVSASMWMFVLEDPASGRRTYCSLNEGLGKVLRYGAYGPEVLERLRWMSSVLGPLLQQAVRASGPTDITGILTQMLQMGDEAHNRNRAGTLMLLRDLAPAMVESGAPAGDIAQAVRFIGGNDHFFLNLAMPACKLALDAARDIDGSTMVVAMARNGTDFGIQVAGTGDRWFTGPAQLADGLYLGDFGPDDANPDIGDSAITETAGIGGFAMATAPAIVRFVGGTVPDALATTRGWQRSPWRRTSAGPSPCSTSPAPRPASTCPGSAGPASCPRSTPAWPASEPAWDRWAPAWSLPRPRSSRLLWLPSPGGPSPYRALSHAESEHRPARRRRGRTHAHHPWPVRGAGGHPCDRRARARPAGARLHREQGGLRPPPAAACLRRLARARLRPVRPVRDARRTGG
jgi:hypothetical protein